MIVEHSVLSSFEHEAVEKVLRDYAPDLLSHLPLLGIERREHTGVGIYVYFNYAKVFDEKKGDDRTLGMQVYAAIKGLNHGAGIILYIDSGILSMLEIFSHASEELPMVIEGEIRTLEG